MEKRYYSYVGHSRALYGARLQKLVIDAGFTCPNRDGNKGIGGCTYCNNNAFHPGYSTPDKTISRQIEEGIEFHKVRYPRAGRYLAYFQSHSNTYAPLDRLKEIYGQALEHPAIEGIVIGTRPDCIDPQKLDYLAGLRDGGKVVILEYGIESCYDRTLLRINRGHDFECARRAVVETAQRGLEVGAHFILGLPGETPQMMLDQCSLINDLPLTSVKFHQLQIIKGTAIEEEYRNSPQDFYRPGLDEYLDLIVDILERLRPDLCIERVAGEVPPRFVSESPWGLVRNFQILHMLDSKLELRGTRQGALYK